MTVIISIVVLDCGCSNSQREYVGWLCCEPQTGGGSIPGPPWDQAAPVLPLIGISAAKEFEK